MRIFTILALFLLILSPKAFAREPYLHNGTDPQNQQWRAEPWVTTDWVSSTTEARTFLQNMMSLGVIEDFWGPKDWRFGTSTLVVGPGFYRLSGFDQRRVLAVVDEFHRATARSSGTLFLRDSHTARVIGYYTARGLWLQ